MKIQLKYCSFEYVPDGCLTEFPDRVKFYSYPHLNDHHYHVISHRSGYGDDLLRYCREHDFFHNFCWEWFCDSPSMVLSLAANDELYPLAPVEELVVMSCQRYVRTNEIPIVEVVPGKSWEEFKGRALHYISLLHIPWIVQSQLTADRQESK